MPNPNTALSASAMAVGVISPVRMKFRRCGNALSSKPERMIALRRASFGSITVRTPCGLWRLCVAVLGRVEDKPLESLCSSWRDRR